MTEEEQEREDVAREREGEEISPTCVRKRGEGELTHDGKFPSREKERGGEKKRKQEKE